MRTRSISILDEPELHYLINWTASNLRAQAPPRLLLADDPQPFVRASFDGLVLSEGSLREWSADRLAAEIRAKMQQFCPSHAFLQ